jgi:5-(carboxyamino)imidazole ribonucleotide mutase
MAGILYYPSCKCPTAFRLQPVALNGAKNAGILAASIIGAFDTAIGEKMEIYKKDLESAVLKKVHQMKNAGQPNQFDGPCFIDS